MKGFSTMQIQITIFNELLILIINYHNPESNIPLFFIMIQSFHNYYNSNPNYFIQYRINYSLLEAVNHL
jgi:hypothetical protein